MGSEKGKVAAMMTIDSHLNELKARIVAIVTHEMQSSDVTNLWTARTCEKSNKLNLIVSIKASLTRNKKNKFKLLLTLSMENNPNSLLNIHIDNITHIEHN